VGNFDRLSISLNRFSSFLIFLFFLLSSYSEDELDSDSEDKLNSDLRRDVDGSVSFAVWFIGGVVDLSGISENSMAALVALSTLLSSHFTTG
jgi:hypothetical protein